MLNLYFNPLSPYTHKVLFFLEEAGIPYKSHLVELGKPEGRATLDRLNPLGAVPTIEHDGFVLSESNAILRYAAQKFGKTSFYPENLEDRARVDQMMDFTTLHVARWMLSLAWNLAMAPKLGRPVSQKSIDDARDSLVTSLPRLERHLMGGTFLNGPSLSIADCAMAPFAASHKLTGLSFGDFPSIQGYFNRLGERPAWKKTQAELDKAMPR